MLVAPERGSQSDGDLVHVYEYAGYAGYAGALDAEAWIAERSDEAGRMIKTEIFRRLLDEVSYTLLAEKTIGADRTDEIMGKVPGATTAALAAREREIAWPG